MQRPKISIRSAADLFEAMRHPSAGVRLPTLERIASQPLEALAYGAHEGKDVIDELCDQLVAGEGIFAPALFAALSRFSDPRVVALSLRLARESLDAQLVRLAIGRLAIEEVARKELRTLLWDELAMRAGQAAFALLGCAGLSDREKVRIACWTGEAEGTEGCREAWLEELRGPFQLRARRCLESIGRSAFVWLSRGSDPEGWLLEWGARDFPEEARPLLEAALKTDQVALALSLLPTTPLAVPLLSSDVARVRALAWEKAELGETDWLARMEQEADLEVRSALARRMADQCGDLDSLVALASDADWRVRAQAARGMTRLGARDAARRLALAEPAEVKAVGLKVLVDLEDFEWMEEKVILPGY